MASLGISCACRNALAAFDERGAGGDRDAQAEAIMRACAFKAAVVGDDEREEKPNDGRALLNLGHTFGHAAARQEGA